jgi:uncharacterized membrane protein HdeD (DUF308 family)
MSFVYNVLLFLHFIGMAMLVGGFLAQMRAVPRQVTQWMRDGAFTQLLTGLALGGLAGSHIGTDENFSPAAVGTKLLIALIVAVACVVGMRQPADKQQTWWALAGGLAIFNVLLAVFWLTATATTGA